MNKIYFKTSVLLAFSILLSQSVVQAGNPDRQGEAGAYELLMNPWARSAGLHTMTASMVRGVDAMRINPAGMAWIERTEITVGHADYLSGTGTNMTAIGFNQKMGAKRNGTLGVSLMSVGFGEIPVTTEAQPEGTGATYSPTFFNLGLGYAYVFDDKIAVGFIARVVAEGNHEINGMGFAIDAGVQYTTGERDNFKFGISLRNVGTKIRFSGQALSIRVQPPENSTHGGIILKQDAAAFDLPSMLHIGLSNDFYAGANHRITALAAFTANSFSRDQVGVGLEYSLLDRFMLRGGYKIELGEDDDRLINNVYSGVSVGATVSLGINPDNPKSRLFIDYAYRMTDVFDGTHNFGVTIAF